MSLLTIHQVEAKPGNDSTSTNDPWHSTNLNFEQRDNWLLSYIDILTLFLTLFVVLLVLEPEDKSAIKSSDAIVVSSAPPPVVAKYDVVKNDLHLASIPSTPWSILDEAKVDIQLSLKPELSDFEDTENMPLFVEEEQPETISIQLMTKVESVSPQVISPADRMIEKLTATGLSERLLASKIDQAVQLEVNDNILFAPGSVGLKSEGKSLLDDLWQLFNENDAIITIEGHTDDRPISSIMYPSNWELSSGRANMVARYLINRGYDPGRLRTLGYADTRPLASNDTAEGRARNRRVSLVVRFSEHAKLRKLVAAEAKVISTH